MPDKVPVSVVVITKNEEKSIEACLSSVHGWTGEIILVDDESADNTLKIAAKFTDKIFSRKMDNEGRHRNWAYSKAGLEWVLSLDADEIVSEELKQEISRVIPAPGFTAFSVPLRNYIGDYWVRHGGWYPASKVRLFKKDKFRYEEVEVHPRVFIDGKCGHLKGDIIHKSYADFEEFLNSVNRQTTLEAVKWIKTGRKMSLLHASWRTTDRFFRRFLRKKGYKDGLYGFMIAFFDSLYQVLSYAKYRQMQKERT